MKRTLLSAALFVFTLNLQAQLSGAYHVPATYSTLAAVISALNVQGISGAVTINIAAGYTETAVAGGYSLYASGTAASPIVFCKSGSGANPLLYAYAGGSRTPGSAVQDGIWRLIGCDYITIDGIDLKDPNTSNPATMEFGFGLFKSSPGDGCRYNTIRNCAVSLSRVNNASGSGPAGDGSRGIEMVNATPAAHNVALTVSVQTGANSYNRFYGNTISHCNIGIALQGYQDVWPFLYVDTGNEIGGNSSADGNSILNFGGGGSVASAGIRTEQQYDLLVGHNLLNSNTGAGINHAATLRGIYVTNAQAANVSVMSNTVSLHGGGTGSQLSAIDNSAGSAGSTNTVAITGNLIKDCDYPTAVSGSFYGIWNSSSAANLYIHNNTLSGNSTHALSGGTYLIYNSGAVQAQLTFSNNSLGFHYAATAAYSGPLYSIHNSGGTGTATLAILSNSFTGYHHFNAPGTGPVYLVSNSASVSALTIAGNLCKGLRMNHSGAEYFISNSSDVQNLLSVTDNTLTAYSRLAPAGNLYGYYGVNSSAGTCVQTFSGNILSNITASLQGTGSFYGLYISDGSAAPYPQKNIYRNLVSGVRVNGTGTFCGIYAAKLGSAGSTGSAVHSNTVCCSSFSDLMYGISLMAPTSSLSAAGINSNVVRELTTGGATSPVYAVYAGGANSWLDIDGNKIAGIKAAGSGGSAHGIYCNAGGTLGISNNVAGNIYAPNASGTARANGLYLNTGCVADVSFNTLHLDGASTGANFSSSALYATSAVSLTLRNNILINTAIPGGSGISAAFRRSSSSATNYLTASDNNLFYAGTPAPNRVIYYNGSAYQTLPAFQTLVSPREAASVTQAQAFKSFVSQSPDFLHVTANLSTPAESGAVNISGITLDIDAEVRQGNTGYNGQGTSPDIGADEFELNTTPCLGVTAATISATGPICAGDSVFLHARGFTAGTGLSHQWKVASAPGGPYTNVSGGSAGNLTEYTSGALTAGTYYFAMESTCSSLSVSALSGHAIVVVNAIPTATLTLANATVCAGQNLILSGSSDIGTTYSWEGPGGFSSALQHPGLTVTGAANAGVYAFSASHGGCASPVATLQLQVSQITLGFVVARSSLCLGETATLTASGASSYSWSSGASGNSITVTPPASTLYSVAATNSINCYADTSFAITVVNPTIAASGALVCEPAAMATLSAVAFTPSALHWYASPTSTHALASGSGFALTAPVLTTTYYAQAGSGRADSLAGAMNGTASSQGIMFDLLVQNALTLTGFDLGFSTAGSAALEFWYRAGTYVGFSNSGTGWLPLGTATVNSQAPGLYQPVALSSPAVLVPGQTYGIYMVVVSGPSLLHQGGLTGAPLQNQDLKLLTGMTGNAYFNLNNPGMAFDGSVKYYLAGCTSPRIPVTLTVSAGPSLSISPVSVSVCAGNAATLQATGAATYSWSVPGAGSLIVVNPTVTTTYSLSGAGADGCVADTNVTILVFSLPVIAMAPVNASVCPSAKISFTASGAQTYTWSTGATGSVVNVSPPAGQVFTVTGTDTIGCVSTSTIAVSTKTVPVIKLQPASGTVCPGETVSFTASGAHTYTWFPGGTASQGFTANPLVSSAYNAIGTSVNGCSNIAMAMAIVDACTGLSEISGPDVAIFPNPAGSVLNVVFPSKEPRILYLLDAGGRILYRVETIEPAYTLELSGYARGLHLLRVAGREGTRSLKFVIGNP